MDKRISVLIAEANFNYGMKLAKYLKIKNCNARNLNHCNNIENLFDKIEKYKPDVLICNAQLFYCDIVWLVRKIKSIQNHIHLILLMPRKDWRIETLAKKDYITCVYMPYDFYKIYEEIIIKNNCIKLFMEDSENKDCFRHFMSKYSDFAYRSCKIDCKITNARFIELMAGTFKDYCMQ